MDQWVRLRDLVAELASRQEWTPYEAIHTLRELYLRYEGEGPKQINDGHCEDFAELLNQLLGRRGLVYWDNDFHDGDGSHAFLKIAGRYYDAEAPEGVENWRDLPYFQGNPRRQHVLA